MGGPAPPSDELLARLLGQAPSLTSQFSGVSWQVTRGRWLDQFEYRECISKASAPLLALEIVDPYAGYGPTAG